MESNSKVLLYGFTNEEISKIEEIFSENNMPSIFVLTNGMAKIKINDIIKGNINLAEDLDLPNEKLVLFNNVLDKQIEKVLPGVRRLASKSPIFAAVTPVSINWSLKYLLEHMIEERNWYLKQNK